LSEGLSYEDALKRAHSEGWRDPIEITNMEIRAYEAGMLTERKRVLSIFKGIWDKPSMRIIDIIGYLERIKKPNNKV
jgi:hypothetical protein